MAREWTRKSIEELVRQYMWAHKQPSSGGQTGWISYEYGQLTFSGTEQPARVVLWENLQLNRAYLLIDGLLSTFVSSPPVIDPVTGAAILGYLIRCSFNTGSIFNDLKVYRDINPVTGAGIDPIMAGTNQWYLRFTGGRAYRTTVRLYNKQGVTFDGRLDCNAEPVSSPLTPDGAIPRVIYLTNT